MKQLKKNWTFLSLQLNIVGENTEGTWFSSPSFSILSGGGDSMSGPECVRKFTELTSLSHFCSRLVVVHALQLSHIPR